ncbi:Uncharacterized protein QTN25_000019 [Entamoeba marina]
MHKRHDKKSKSFRQYNKPSQPQSIPTPPIQIPSTSSPIIRTVVFHNGEIVSDDSDTESCSLMDEQFVEQRNLVRKYSLQSLTCVNELIESIQKFEHCYSVDIERHNAHLRREIQYSFNGEEYERFILPYVPKFDVNELLKLHEQYMSQQNALVDEINQLLMESSKSINKISDTKHLIDNSVSNYIKSTNEIIETCKTYGIPNVI